jgi:hypothetical protein
MRGERVEASRLRKRSDKIGAVRRRVTSSSGLLLLLAAIAMPAPAGAQSRSSELAATGSVTVTWRGDAARGCAGAAVCDVQGRTVLPVDARGQLNAFGPARAGRIFGFLFDDRSTPVVRVTRTGAGDPPPICVDVPPSGGFGPGGLGLGFLPRRAGRVVLAIRTTPALSAGRCAGPLSSDLADALPSTEASATRLLAGTTVELSGRRAFTAGPFSGEVVSAVRVVVARARTRGARRPGILPRRPPRPRRRVVVARVRALALDYRITSVRGAVTSSFAGLPDPGCRPLDACALTGATTVTPRAGASLALRARGSRAAVAAGGSAVRCATCAPAGCAWAPRTDPGRRPTCGATHAAKGRRRGAPTRARAHCGCRATSARGRCAFASSPCSRLPRGTPYGRGAPARVSRPTTRLPRGASRCRPSAPGR